MNVQEKEKQQKIINTLISGVEFATKEAVKSKNAFREKMNSLTMQGTATYSQEYLQREMEKLRAEILTKMKTVNVDMAERLENLRTLIHDRDAVLDLANPALANALSLIPAIAAMGDTRLPERYELAVKINAALINDQSGLKALKAAYIAAGLENAGGIDDLIYDLDSTINHLIELAYQAFIQEASVNQFSYAFSKFAKLEGMTTETMPDQVGAYDAYRAAAGL